MSENFDDTIDSDIQQEESPKALRDAANRSGKYKAEAESLRRENAFLKAGISVEDQRMTYFVRGYDGELTTEAIRKAAQEAGFISTQSQQPPAAAAQRRMVAAAAGATPEGSTGSGDISRLEDAMAEGGVAAMTAVLNELGIPVSQ